MKNTEKILNFFMKNESEYNIGTISDATGIDIKNISRYITQLVEAGKLQKRIMQMGKRRFVMVSPNEFPLTPQKEKPATPQKEKPTTHAEGNVNIEYLKKLILRSTHRRVITQEESKKALDILYKL